ncbi:MAG: hypothetical protein PHN57_00705 [Candidatus Omnitrophica bacterium]|nr:hypothetical protein [Candidatus Omnitrophota bacterium]
MNKKQLIAAWVTGVLICVVMLFTPRITTWQNGLLILRTDKAFLAPLVNWSLVTSYCLVILIIGVLAVYTLKDKQK